MQYEVWLPRGAFAFEEFSTPKRRKLAAKDVPNGVCGFEEREAYRTPYSKRRMKDFTDVNQPGSNKVKNLRGSERLFQQI